MVDGYCQNPISTSNGYQLQYCSQQLQQFIEKRNDRLNLHILTGWTASRKSVQVEWNYLENLELNSVRLSVALSKITEHIYTETETSR